MRQDPSARTFRRGASLGVLLAALGLPAQAAVPAGFVERAIVTGLGSGTAMAFAPDGRLFVAQQGGALRVIKNGRLLATPFVSLTVNADGERGLLGIAFDPLFTTTDPYVYVYYTATSPSIHNRVSRFRAQGDVAQAGSEQVLLDLENLSATNHNGGAIHFGPDGKLYVAVGENAVPSNAQSLANRLGKILRINKDGTIPMDNPFFNTPGANQAIWALGLRNPFTFGFNADGSRMHINDVGAGTWEEVNTGVAGSNYGWPTTEGPTNNPAFRSPLYAYQHNAGSPTGCAIVGAAFHDADKVTWPAGFENDYFFGDLCSDWIYRVDPATPATATQFATGLGTPVDLGIGPEGDLYYLAREATSVGRISTDVIFDDGVETGALGAWDALSAGGGDLTVTGAAALDGSTQGIEAIVDDTTPLFVEDDTPNDENRYRARFWLDPNGFDPGEANGKLRVRIFLAFEEAPLLRRLVAIILRRVSGAYSLMARIRLDSGLTADTAFVPISDGPHAIEIDWRRAGTGAATNGGFTLFVDGVSAATLPNLDNGDRAIDFLRLGVMTVKAGANGTLYFDEFVSRREAAIGP